MEERYGVVSELSTPMLVLYTFGYGSQSGDTRRLVVALERLVRRLARRAADVKRKVAPRETQTAAVGSLVAAVQLPEPVVEMLPRDAFFADAERCVRIVYCQLITGITFLPSMMSSIRTGTCTWINYSDPDQHYRAISAGVQSC